jgi:hypothetical protein
MSDRIVEIGEIADDIVLIFRRSPITPYDTGNLKYNAIVATPISENEIKITIGGERAPYAVYLEFSPFAGSSKVIPNRHLGFVEKILEGEVIPYLETL